MVVAVVVAHDDRQIRGALARGLHTAGYQVFSADCPADALDYIDAHPSVQVLVTRVNFAGGRPEGISLALTAQARRPGLLIVFAAMPQYAADVRGIGLMVSHPSTALKVVETVDLLVASQVRACAGVQHAAA